MPKVFEIAVPNAALDDLASRLKATRLAEMVVSFVAYFCSAGGFHVDHTFGL